jgi:hypothetical protein
MYICIYYIYIYSAALDALLKQHAARLERQYVYICTHTQTHTHTHTRTHTHTPTHMHIYKPAILDFFELEHIFVRLCAQALRASVFVLLY